MRKISGVIWIITFAGVILCTACEAQQVAHPALRAQAIQVAEQSREPTASRWMLSIAHSLDHQSHYRASHLRLRWSGSFTVTDRELSGSGMGHIAGQHRCGDDREPAYDVTGEFTFQITGRQIRRSDGRPLFQLLIEGHDLTLRSDAKCTANFDEIAVVSRLESLVEQLPALVDHIEIESRTGATATIPLPDVLAIFGKAPLEVGLASVPGN